MSIIEFFFWLLLFLIIYTYFIYPILISLISALFRGQSNKKEILLPISIILAVYNEEEYIGAKIENLLALDYPRGMVEIIIGSDGSTDRTNDIVQSYASEQVKFIYYREQRGKVSVIKDLVSKSSGDIILFADARQKFNAGAAKELVANFADSNVGCVTGELIFDSDTESAVTEGYGAYWKYEKFLRSKEGRIGYVLGATGAIYAIRKELFVGPPLNTLLDDVYIPFQIICRGYKVVFESKALAVDKYSKDAATEMRRKIRTIAGNWQIFLLFRQLFNPFCSKVCFQLISHKLLRAIVPFFLVLIFILNAFLIGNAAYRTFFILQVFFYLMALLGLFAKIGKIAVFKIPTMFCVLNYAAILGFFYYLTNKQSVKWK